MKRLIIILSLVFFLFIMGCTGKIESILKGSYQSEPQKNGYIIQMSFNKEEGSFVHYIDNREVDNGTYEKKDTNIYQIKSDKQNYEVKLDGKGDYEIIINNINNGSHIQMFHVDDVPTYFSTEFGDEDEYKALLDKH